MSLGGGMRVARNIFGILLIAGLSACAQSSGLPQIALLGGGDDQAKSEAAASTESIEMPGGGPPLPARNERLMKATAGRAHSKESETKQAGLSLPRLSDVKLFTPTAYVPDSVQWDQGPVQVYAQLAQQIRACWFTPGAPKLTNHGFYATVADGDAGEATIIIYQKDENGGRGVQAFRILISGSSSASTVKAENRRLESKLDQNFKTDISRWAKGGKDC